MKNCVFFNFIIIVRTEKRNVLPFYGGIMVTTKNSWERLYSHCSGKKWHFYTFSIIVNMTNSLFFSLFLLFFVVCYTGSSEFSLKMIILWNLLNEDWKIRFLAVKNSIGILKTSKKQQKLASKKIRIWARSMGCRNFCDKIQIYLKNFVRNFWSPQKFLTDP